jgi:hypothetical protein
MYRLLQIIDTQSINTLFYGVQQRVYSVTLCFLFPAYLCDWGWFLLGF